MKTWMTGVRYHFYHAFAVIAVGLTLLHIKSKSKTLDAAAVCFCLGIGLFSGSIYALVISKVSIFGMFAAVGGVFQLTGWLLFIGGIWKANFDLPYLRKADGSDDSRRLRYNELNYKKANLMKKENKWIGYCTNVHAGFDLDVTKANLEKYALSVKQKCSPDEAMGIGLWLSANAVGEMIRENQVREFAGWLEANQLVPFTFNGFPHGNFHQDVVKHLVYLPTWADDSRREYSEQLADVIDQLLPPGMEGSISTLPLAWQDEKVDDEFLRKSANQLILLARHLEELEKTRNRLVYFCIEPEPGCVLQTSQTCVDFFKSIYSASRFRLTIWFVVTFEFAMTFVTRQLCLKSNQNSFGISTTPV